MLLEDRFEYVVADPSGEVDTATLTFVLGQPNRAPCAGADIRCTDSDAASIIGNVLTGSEFGDVADRDPDGDPIEVIGIVSGYVDGLPCDGVGTEISGAYGQIRLADDGAYEYRPGPAARALGVGEQAQDIFTYGISDGRGGFATATITICIVGVDAGPVARPDARTVGETAVVCGDAIEGGEAGDTADIAGDAGPVAIQASYRATRPDRSIRGLAASSMERFSASTEHFSSALPAPIVTVPMRVRSRCAKASRPATSSATRSWIARAGPRRRRSRSRSMVPTPPRPLAPIGPKSSPTPPARQWAT
ncbi:MAG: Ig-like domain-containing protein [Burkholderiaceae bacterium]